MSLEARTMRFGKFVWRRNPETLQVEYQRNVKRLTLPQVGEALQDLGRQRRAVTGNGSFLGKDAAADFERLAAVFREGKSQILCIPGAAPFRAVFASLQMLGEARPNAVRYSFLFLEDEEPAEDDGILRDEYAVCGKGDTLWHVANRYATTVDVLRQCNPQIQWPNRLAEGTKVKLP